MNRSLALHFIANCPVMEEWGNTDCKNVQNFGPVAAGRVTCGPIQYSFAVHIKSL